MGLKIYFHGHMTKPSSNLVVDYYIINFPNSKLHGSNIKLAILVHFNRLSLIGIGNFE